MKSKFAVGLFFAIFLLFFVDLRKVGEIKGGQGKFDVVKFNDYVNNTCLYAPVAVKLSGGLGNHLFGVAAGIDLSIRRAQSFKDLILIKVEETDRRAHQVIPLANSLFSQLQSVDSEIALKKLRRKNSRYGLTSEQLGELAFTKPQIVGKDNHWRQWCRQSREHLLQWADVPCGTPQIVFGYLQNKDFLNLSGPILKRLFAVPEDVALLMRRKYLTPSNQKGGIPWAIHVRRGDYLDSNWHNVPSISYFEDASNMMILHLKNRDKGGGQVLVFSDDLEWVKKQEFFLNIDNVVFVDESDTLTVFYFLTLAAEGGIVCSASTFCWWSAFLSDLGRFPSRLVIFPNKIDAEHSLTGSMGPNDCGNVLHMPYMTVLTSY